MDIDKLKIPEKARRRSGSCLFTALVAAVCLAGGFFAGKYYRGGASSDAAEVETAVVNAAGGAGKRFTAGGWIEASAPAYPVFVSSRISEKLVELNVVEGIAVEPGEIVARMFDANMVSKLALAKANLAARERELEKLQAGYRVEDKAAAEAKLREMTEKARIAEANYERLRKSREANPDTVSDRFLDEKLSEFRQAEAIVAGAKAEYEKLKAGYRFEDIELAKARVAEAEAQADLAEKDLSYCTIYAPETGKVLRVLKVFRTEGEWIDTKEKAALISLYDPADMQARVDITQSNIRSVRVGGECVITTDADPGKEYTGAVLRIDPLAELSKNTVTVKVKINNPDAMLFPDMTARVAFLAESGDTGAPSEITIPSAAVRNDGGGDYVYTIAKGRAAKTAVTIGAERGDIVLVVGGLSSGQRVVISGFENVSDGAAVKEK